MYIEHALNRENHPEPSELKKKTGVLIVDDSAVIRKTPGELLLGDPAIGVMGTASDPFIAAERMLHAAPAA